jgi:hypothetical protein
MKTEQATASTEAEVKIDFTVIDIAKIEADIIKNSHPAANLLPMMSAEEFDMLVISIERNGFDASHAIKKNEDGKIVDGRNREKAIRYVNAKIDLENEARGTKTPHVKAKYETLKLNEAGLLEEVWRDNFTRRNLSSSQKAAAIIRADALSELMAKKKELGEAGQKIRGDMAAYLAKLTGTNHVYVYKCKQLQNGGKVGRGLLAQVAAGDITVMKAIEKLQAEQGAEAGDQGDKAASGEIADGLGNKVPEEHKAIFQDKEEWDTAAKLMRELKRTLEGLGAKRGGVALADRMAEVNTGISGLARVIRDVKPYVVCPHCDGKGHEGGKKKETCPICKGAGFLSKTAYTRFIETLNTPAEAKEEEGTTEVAEAGEPTPE